VALSPTVTREKVQAKKDKAARFVRDVLDDPDRAGEIEDESIEDYAARKKIKITNSRRNRAMANGDTRTKADLLDEIDDLTQQVQDLQDQVEAVADIVAPEDEDTDDDTDDDDGD
jgi:hypothetical protein